MLAVNVNSEHYKRVVKKMRTRVKRYEEWLEDEKMSPAQKEVFIIVDEWWKKFGFSPTLRQIAEMRGKSGIGNTKEIVDRLVRLGALKKLERKRSIRPVYIRYRDVE